MKPLFVPAMLALLFCIAPIPQVAGAATLPQPEGEVVLTLSGQIATPNDPSGSALFDLAMLAALEPVTISTSTIWTQGVQEFTGVRLSRLLAAAGASGTVLHALALNDYAVDIPATDAVEDGPIVAYLLNGKPMPLREKGPLWIIYPFDAKNEYQSEVTYSRSIWQLDRIVVNP